MKTNKVKIFAGVLAAAACLGQAAPVCSFWADGGQGGALDQLGVTAAAEAQIPGEVSMQPVAEVISASAILDYFDLNKRGGKTKFDILADLFSKGEAPALEDMTGWFSGRWVCNDLQDDVRGALFMGEYSEKVPAGGPLFTEKLLSIRTFEGAGATDYDDLTPEIGGKLAAYSKMPAEFKKGEIVFNESRKGEQHYQVRKNGGYLIVKHTTSAKENYFDLNKHVTYAYYFKNVTPGGPR